MISFDEILTKKCPISVVGLGYVGLPVAVAFAKVVDVIGFDVNSTKIQNFKQGIDTTGEVPPEDMSQTTVQFTSNPDDLRKAYFHVVAVPTPISKNNTPDLGAIKSACRLIGEKLQPGAVVVFESTVYPGVTEEICAPILEDISGMVCGKDFFLGYSPERINPGDKVNRLESIIKVVSGMNEQTLDLVAKVYELIIHAGVYRASSIKVAEAAKVIENTQRDINIAFMNELSILFKRMNVDTLEVLEAAKTKWNFLDFKPGLVGGHCIGVDPYYLTYRAQQLGYHPQVILAGRRLNDDMGRFVVESTIKLLLKKSGDLSDCKVAILGFTFKENCPDTRNTRVIDIVNELREYGLTPQIADPVADPKEVFEHYGINLVPLEEIKQVNCLIITVAHEEFKNLPLENLLSGGGVLIDVKGIYEDTPHFTHWRL